MKKLAMVASGLVLALGVAACSGGEQSQDAAAPPAGISQGFNGDAVALMNSASEKTAQVKTAKFTVETAILGQPFIAEGQARFDGANSASSTVMTVAGRKSEVRMVDRTLYMQLPQGLPVQASGGKPWGKVSADDASKTGAMLGQGFDQMSANDPSKTLEQIKNAGTITKSEPSEVNGQPATHYWVEIDLAKVGANAPGMLPKEILDEAAGKVNKYSMEIWLNQDQLPLKSVTDLTPVFSALGLPAETTAKTTVTWRDWGAPVDIQAPPADQVGDLVTP